MQSYKNINEYLKTLQEPVLGKFLEMKKISDSVLAKNKKLEGKVFEEIKYGIPTYVLKEKWRDIMARFENIEVKKEEKIWKISKDVSTKQKGDIAEARIAELITLYGDTTLSCYKPISDDEGIDLIVKEKGSLKTMYIQIKSRFGDNPDEIFTATTKASGVVDNYSMAVVFCYFDTEEGDIWDYLWFVPAPDLIKHANKLDGGKMFGFVAGRKKKESNKWDNYLIDKRDLANQIIAQMKRI
jgi:hypothetical protein